jgi:hypothetical protein
MQLRANQRRQLRPHARGGEEYRHAGVAGGGLGAQAGAGVSQQRPAQLRQLACEREGRWV